MKVTVTSVKGDGGDDSDSSRGEDLQEEDHYGLYLHMKQLIDHSRKSQHKQLSLTKTINTVNRSAALGFS